MNKRLLLSGILSSFLLISTFISAGERSSSLFEGFNFPMGEKTEEFVTATFDDLYNIFSKYSNLTESEKKDSWREYKGKYVRWEGIVNHKGLSTEDWNRVGIRHNVDTNVELIFKNDKEDIVRMVRKGDHVTYTGRLSLLFERNLLFKLEDANIETINGVTVDKFESKLVKKATLPLSSPLTPETSPHSDGKEPAKEENSISFDGLDKIFGKNSGISESNKENLWGHYIGKEIIWQGKVSYKGLSKNDWNRLGINHKTGTNVELVFDEDQEDVVKLIKKGDEITYNGKLTRLFGRNLLCSVENVHIKKIGDKLITEFDEIASDDSLSGGGGESTNKSEVIKEPEIVLTESMAPEVTEREDIDITETSDGFIEVSFDELDDLFGRENRMTESQKDRLWKEYRDKYIRWTGMVMTRGKGRISGLRMGIKHKEGTDVELIFDIEKEDMVLKTEKGDKITYTGKLMTRRGYILPYKLEDGNIENIEKPEQAKD